MKIIPVPASCGITGFESPAKDYEQKALSLDELLIETPSATLLYQIQGDDLKEVGIFDQDLVIVDQSVRVQNSDLVVAELNGEIVCKRINTQYRVLYSSQSTELPITVQEFDEFVVKGVVTRSVRCHRIPKRLPEVGY